MLYPNRGIRLLCIIDEHKLGLQGIVTFIGVVNMRSLVSFGRIMLITNGSQYDFPKACVTRRGGKQVSPSNVGDCPLKGEQVLCYPISRRSRVIFSCPSPVCVSLMIYDNYRIYIFMVCLVFFSLNDDELILERHVQLIPMWGIRNLFMMSLY